jgi:hypothetical protein
MPVLPAEADIRCPAEKIFDVITDFGGQERWLARSSAFRGGPRGAGGHDHGSAAASAAPADAGPRVRTESTRTLMALKAHCDTLG